MSTSYLGINMSGRTYPVVNYRGNKIGQLSHKERCTYCFDSRTINGVSHKKIWFLNRNGAYIEGWLSKNYHLRNWGDYAFNTPYGYLFYIDGQAKVYNSAAQFTGLVLNHRDQVAAANHAQSGHTKKGFLKLDYIVGPSKQTGTGISYMDGYYVDTGVTKRSGNTNVYGNWN